MLHEITMSRNEIGIRTITFNVTVPESDKIDEFWRKNLFYNKTEFLTKAINEYINGVECPFCHAHNPRGGRICSVCLRPLSIDDEVNVAINVIDTRRREIEED